MYYLSLCCIIKDEGNLEEFIIYYILLGVVHFYIYDNESTFPIKERLNSFLYKHYCTIIDFPGRCQQMNAYNDCVKKFGKNIEWLIIVDGDEYILPKMDNTLVDFLKKRENAQSIGINWVFFGTSFHKNKRGGFLVDNYRYCQNGQDRHVKSIFKPKYFLYMDNPHYAIMEDPERIVDPKGNKIVHYAFNDCYTIDIIQINHYVFKSLEENNEKHYRGNADTLNRRNISDEGLHNYFNEIVDNILPDKYLEKMKKMYSLSCVNFSIYKALNPDISNMTEDEVSNHIIQYGINENRYLHSKDKFPDFSIEKYRESVPHLYYMNNVDLEVYYINTH